VDIETYDRYKYRFVTLVWAILWSFVIAHGAQWALGAFDIAPKNIWFQGAFLVLTLLFWAPWSKPKLRPRNDGNNDLFPGM
jgi:hypothetical protein